MGSRCVVGPRLGDPSTHLTALEVFRRLVASSQPNPFASLGAPDTHPAVNESLMEVERAITLPLHDLENTSLPFLRHLPAQMTPGMNI